VRSGTVVGLMVLVLWLTTERADAGFRVCNQFEQRLSVAFGYVDRTKGWVAQGWWVINPGQCTNVHGDDLDNRYYYVFAQPTAGGPPWKGGKVAFCIQDKSFLLYQAEYGKNTAEDCAKAGLQSAAFISVDVGPGEKNHTFNFSGNASPNPVAVAPPSGPPVAAAPPPSQPPVAVAPRPTPPPAGSGGGGGAACQRFPNLC
jgi:uncharacterized membrane protein